jgi:16S rRNA (adenine1518-N6/adenine1519-N6)-dimethyltransferase
MNVTKPDFLAGLEKYKVISNIPYHLTSDIIRRFTEQEFPPTRAVFLIQKEVAARLTAQPPDMNQLALFTQWFAAITKIAIISREAFNPIPEVDSAIVRLDIGQGVAARYKISIEKQRELFSLIKRGFSNPRKQLANNLSINKMHPARAKSFDFLRRAETLTHDEWITLLQLLSE